MELERRHIDLPIELRAEAGKPAKLVGYVARFNSLSLDLGGFKERIMPGAFGAAIKQGADIRALCDHDYTRILGRTSNGTLSLEEDEDGLRCSIDVPDTTYGRDTLALVKRGDVRGMSFGFTVPAGGERFTSESGTAIRELLAIDLREVTVTSIPAYRETSVQVRVDPTITQRLPATGPGRERWMKLRKQLIG